MECSICLNSMDTNNNDTVDAKIQFSLKAAAISITGMYSSLVQTNATCPICRDFVYQVLLVE